MCNRDSAYGPFIGNAMPLRVYSKGCFGVILLQYSPSCTFRGKYDKGDKRSLGPFERSTYRNVGMQNFPINFLP